MSSPLGWKAEDAAANRRIIEQNVDRDPLGSQLTPEARERAINFGLQSFEGRVTNGEASRLGILHAASDVLKPK